MTRELIKVGNRDLNGNDFTWTVGEWLTNQTTPPELMTIERREWGNFYGTLEEIRSGGKVLAHGPRDVGHAIGPLLAAKTREREQCW